MPDFCKKQVPHLSVFGSIQCSRYATKDGYCWQHYLDARVAELERVVEAAYIEDCHVSGMHDPEHTARHLCQIQLSDVGKRVLSALFGVNWDAEGNAKVAEMNKIPRKVDRGGWYKYYQENEKYQHKAAELDVWEKNGFPEKEEDSA